MSDTFLADGDPTLFETGDTVLTALVRSRGPGALPGALCCGGDCPHCLATVDGVPYVRMCQEPARAGLQVEPHAADAVPAVASPASGEPVVRRHRTVDVVVVGGGTSGHSAADAAVANGESVLVIDAHDGDEAVGLYAGPTVLVRTRSGMLEISCSRIVVATGASEIQPACPGNDLAGILTAQAASALAQAGVALDGAVLVTSDPELPAIASADLGVRVVHGRLIGLEADPSAPERVGAVHVDTEDGEQRHGCSVAIVDLGRQPRDALARMGQGLPVTVVGDAAIDHPMPPCPTSGTVCPCSSVTVDQLTSVWDRGFREMELVKRATLAGTGTCQGSACLPHLRAFLGEHGVTVPAPFTARPVNRQLTLAEAAAGEHHHLRLCTALDGEHRSLGAQMEAMGGWMRPWTYGDTLAEYTAARERVSIGDVSTLGTFLVSGPDAESLLQRIYPTDVSTIRHGRTRYALVLDERGTVLDDGMVGRLGPESFTLSFTSGGASTAEMWLRDWATGLDVRILNQTLSVGAINVTGPRATELLTRLGLDNPLPFLGFTDATIAGVPCTIFRLSFTGEVSYELHHPASRSVDLWRALLEAGRAHDIAPHGLEALMWLRLEKGHIVVGQDTDFDSTPARLDHGWAVNMAKGDFLGRGSLLRTVDFDVDRQLVGLTTAGRPPFEGATIWDGDRYAGYVTSSAWSPTLGQGVMLAWMKTENGALASTVRVEDLTATRVELPFYDPSGARARA